MVDDQNQALETAPAESASDSPAENVPVSEQSQEQIPAAEEQTEVPQEAEEAPKKGAQARIRELNAKARTATEEVQSLKRQLADLTGIAPQDGGPTIPYNPQEPIIRPGEEIDGAELSRRLEAHTARAEARAAAQAELKYRQLEAITRINNEAAAATAAYPELDPDSETFDKELSESVTEACLAYVRQNPYSASPKAFVDKLMKPFKRAVTQEVGKAQEVIARQASGAAQRPTAVSSAGKKAHKDMSIKELEAELGIEY